MIETIPLIVTRPLPGNAATVERARALGLDARAVPLFAARPLEWEVPQASRFDALLLTSAQAVRLAGPGLAGLASLPVHAVGAATARAAEATGLTVLTTGSAGAEQLLDAVTSDKIQKILWLCGRERSEFDAGRAEVEPLPCYTVDSLPPPTEWFDLIAAPAVLLAHSARAARRLSGLVGDARAHLALVAISPGAAAAAGGGWRDLAVATRPDDPAMLAAGHALCNKGG